ncbi:hypothetical protein NP493_574g01040 [Ridgeia piscesae]|uniref:Nuclear nucleic acid-binding protein C1D n=1 Tax=Ridgeia piscesae TaxID=27915 RepID=A0AAD9KV14_RIDPI|nr:hypothetical protein NP493_574g01040 [Ridgeia piscesae]
MRLLSDRGSSETMDDNVVVDESFPTELQERLTDFDDALTQVEEVLKPLHSVPLSDIHTKLSTLDKAKLDLVGVYTINSLFWMYLNTRGEDPKEHAVKQELERIQRYMKRLQEVQDKEKAPKLNKDASKRFIRSALWQQAHKEAEQPDDEAQTQTLTPTTSKTTRHKDVITVDSDSDSGVPTTKKTKQTPQSGRRRRKKDRKQ